ncbi:MAG: hypothetical protein ACOYIK_04250 [Coriobacteriales bacterium]
MTTQNGGSTSRKTIFEELCAMIDIPDRPYAVRKAKAYRVKFLLLRWGPFALLFLFYFLLIFSIIDITIFSILLLVIVFLTPILNVQLAKNSNKILNDHCDTIGAITNFAWMIKYFWRKEKYCLTCLFNVGIAEIYSGRIDDAERVRWICDQRFQSPFGAYTAASIGIEVDISRKDWASFHRDYDIFVQASSDIKQRNAYRINQVLQYPMLVRLYNDGNYGALYEGISKFSVFRKVNSLEVRRNYYQYRVALLMGNTELAQFHGSRVALYGGTTCYRAEVTGIPVEQLQPIDVPPKWTKVPANQIPASQVPPAQAPASAPYTPPQKVPGAQVPAPGQYPPASQVPASQAMTPQAPESQPGPAAQAAEPDPESKTQDSQTSESQETTPESTSEDPQEAE